MESKKPIAYSLIVFAFVTLLTFFIFSLEVRNSRLTDTEVIIPLLLLPLSAFLITFIGLKIYNSKLVVTQEKEKYEKMVKENISPIIILHEGRVKVVNQAATEVLGISRNKLKGKNFLEFIDNEDEKKVRESFSEALSRGSSDKISANVVRKTGERREILLKSSRVDFKDYGVLISFMDLTERNKMQKRLTEINKLSRKLTLSLDKEEICEETINIIKNTINYDRILISLFDKNKKKLVNKKSHNYPKNQNNMERMRSRKVYNLIYQNKEPFYASQQKNQKYLNNSEKAKFIVPLMAENKFLGTISISETDREKIPQDSRELLEALSAQVSISLHNAELITRLDKRNEMKDLIISIINQDLRKPLQSISSHSKNIRKSKTLKEAKRESNKIKSSTREMEELIDNMMTLLKLENESIEYEKIDLTKVIEDSINQLSDNLKNYEVKNKVEGSYLISGNRIIKQAFINLIENAQKYSQLVKKIEIGIKNDENGYIVYVKDWGPGIPDEKKENIFTKFSRNQKKENNSGLGLSIVKRTVDLHNGEVWVEDNPEGGSIFKIKLPKYQNKLNK